MPDPDQKLAAERDLLVQQLAGLADALNGLSLERLAEALPMVVAPIDEAVRRARAIGVSVRAGDGLDGAAILRDGHPHCPLCDTPTPPEAFMLPAIVLGSDPGVPEAMCPSCAALRPEERSVLRTEAMTRRLQRSGV